jgi:hypothetical protein
MSIFKYLAQSSLSKNALLTWIYLYGIIENLRPFGIETLSFIYSECAVTLKISESEMLKVLDELEKENLIYIHVLSFPFPDSVELTVNDLW